MYKEVTGPTLGMRATLKVSVPINNVLMNTWVYLIHVVEVVIVILEELIWQSHHLF